MSNTIKQRPIEPVFAELQGKGFDPLGPFCTAIRDLITRADKTVTNLGEIQSVAPILGRTEGIATTVTGLAATGDIKATTKVVGRTEGLGTTTANLDATGKLTSTDAIAADGTGSPLTGGKRGAIALDTNNRLANSFRANAANVSNTPTASTNLSNDGVATAIPVTAYTSQFPPGTISYNSGSIDPGSFGGVFVYFDDPTFAGGAVPYQFTATTSVQTAAEGRTIVGQITSVNGTAKTGGGSSGGTGGRAGGRGFITG